MTSRWRSRLAGRRVRRLTAAVVIGLIAVLLLGAGGALALGRTDLLDRFDFHAATTPAPPPALSVTSLQPVPSDAPIPLPDALAAKLAPALANPDLGMFTGRVTDALTGQPLWQQGEDTPQTPGSVTKILTAAAARLTLPLDQRVATTVVPGSVAGQLVLVGGGDPTLTAAPMGTSGYYPDGAHLDDLADQIRSAGVPVESLSVDTSLFAGPTMAAGWDVADIAGGSITPIEQVMLDGGRLQPIVVYSPRTPTPALDAGRALAQRLGIDPSTVGVGVAPPGATAVATVWSAPLSQRLHQMLVSSDDVLAETLGREIAHARGAPLTFDGSVAAVTAALRDAGFDTTRLELRDVSGLSTEDLIPAQLIDQVLTAAAGDGDPRLRPLLDDLAIAGGSGTLWDRFTGPAGPSQGAGWIRAKTGTLSGVSSLAGIVTDSDNRVLTFTFLSTGTPPELAQPALDATALVLRDCGCR